jgi:uncharacterized protein YjbI with pentapeptide repeats
MSAPPDAIERINALTRNARSTWFALLGVLVFVGITLMGVEHIDFYGVNRATKLPLVDVEVPTRYFFIAAPILTAAIYGYFHLYLIRLWDALGSAPARINGQPLGDAISPWLITDAALHLRHWFRKDYCTTLRTMEGPAMVLNFLLAWGAGLLVFGFLWWQSMPARIFWMTGIAGVALLTALYTGLASLAMCVLRMKASGNGVHINIWSTVPAMSSLLVIVPAVIAFSYQRTNGSIQHLAPLNLLGEDIVEKPTDWLPHEYEEKEFRFHWCKREGFNPCTDFGDREKEFLDEWQTRRQSTIAALRKPGFNTVSLTEAQEDVGQIDLVSVSENRRQKAYETLEALSQRAPNMQQADLRNTFLSGANLTTARLRNADLSGAQMEGVILYGAQLQEAVLIGAQLQEAVLSGAQLQEANLSFSLLTGTEEKPNILYNTNLSASINNGSALRFADIRNSILDSKTDFRNAFMDASVLLPINRAMQMRRPCQMWHLVIKSDEEFFGRWRGWVEKKPNQLWFEHWSFIAPPE